MTGFSKWPWWRRWFGRKAERTAAAFLRTRGYRILATNVDDRRGELDILAIHGDLLAVVEVRSSESRSLPAIAATVDFVKQKRIADATLRFLSRRRKLGITVRFDILAVRWPPGEPPEFLLIPGAFDSPGRGQMWS